MSRLAASNEDEKTDRLARQNAATLSDVLLYDAGIAEGKARATERIVAWLREEIRGIMEQTHLGARSAG